MGLFFFDFQHFYHQNYFFEEILRQITLEKIIISKKNCVLKKPKIKEKYAHFKSDLEKEDLFLFQFWTFSNQA